MERLQSIVESISRVSAYVAGGFLLMASVLITFEVIVRKLFSFSLAGADELSGYVYAIGMTWGYAYALHRRAHIRVDAVYMWLPRVARCVLDVISLLAFSAIILLLTQRAYILFENTISMGSRADTPMATPLLIPQGLWVLGLAFFAFCILLLLTRSALALARGDLATVETIAHGPHGTSEADEEVRMAMKAKAGRAIAC